jgi:hypothetical protein
MWLVGCKGMCFSGGGAAGMMHAVACPREPSPPLSHPLPILCVHHTQASGGWIHNDRLQGVLAVSRAFGDVEHKTLKEKCWEKSFKADPLIAVPVRGLGCRQPPLGVWMGEGCVCVWRVVCVPRLVCVDVGLMGGGLGGAWWWLGSWWCLVVVGCWLSIGWVLVGFWFGVPVLVVVTGDSTPSFSCRCVGVGVGFCCHPSGDPILPADIQG